jgi:hypothetical protein
MAKKAEPKRNATKLARVWAANTVSEIDEMIANLKLNLEELNQLRNLRNAIDHRWLTATEVSNNIADE